MRARGSASRALTEDTAGVCVAFAWFWVLVVYNAGGV